jgi:hypothetical protein
LRIVSAHPVSTLGNEPAMSPAVVPASSSRRLIRPLRKPLGIRLQYQRPLATARPHAGRFGVYKALATVVVIDIGAFALIAVVLARGSRVDEL